MLATLRDLRQVEAVVDPAWRPKISTALDYLESTLGSTIRPAEAARFLGVSQPALTRWIDRGEVPAVRTPSGRREIPVSDLLELIEDVDQKRDEGWERPLAAAIRARHEQAENSIDLDLVMPRRRPRGHRTAELQSLAYHRVIAQRLDDRLIANANRKLTRWRSSNRIHPRWADEWQRLLEKSPSHIARAISADTTKARELRQTSPFAGLLNAQERRLLTRSVEERAR
jgi:excisionase family DNA binding protein